MQFFDYARAPEKIQKGAEEIKRAHRSSLHSVPLAIRLISKPTPRTFQVNTKQNQRIISCFPAWDRMREDWKQKRKQAPEPDGGGACVRILNLSLCSSVNALYQISKGTRNFPKRQRKNQEWSRGARSTPFRSLQSQFRESPVYSVRRNKKILRYCLEFPR